MPGRAPIHLFGALLLAAPFSIDAGDGPGLAGSEWKPLRIGARDVPEGSRAFVQFRNQGRLEGFGGCNRFFADYEASDGRLSVGPVTATRKTCVDNVTQREIALLAALGSARSYHRERVRLVLFDGAGQPLIEMRQTDWD
jgi:heat shock protein HslJ